MISHRGPSASRLRSTLLVSMATRPSPEDCHTKQSRFTAGLHICFMMTLGFAQHGCSRHGLSRLSQKLGCPASVSFGVTCTVYLPFRPKYTDQLFSALTESPSSPKALRNSRCVNTPTHRWIAQPSVSGSPDPLASAQEPPAPRATSDSRRHGRHLHPLPPPHFRYR